MLYSPFYSLNHGHSLWRDLPSETALNTQAGQRYDLITPPELIIVGRAISVLLSVTTVVLTGTFARLIAGQWTEIVSMALVAVCPALVGRASNVIIDTFATLFSLASLYCCYRIANPTENNGARTLRWEAGLAGLSAGLAFSCKYTVVVVFVSVLAAIAMLRMLPSIRLLLALLATTGLSLGIALGAPLALLKPVSAVEAVWASAYDYTKLKSSPGYFGQAITSSELGWTLVLAGSLGFLLMLRSQITRRFALSWVIFAISLISLFVAKPFQPFRNLVPLVPPFCIAAAFTLTLAFRLPDLPRLRETLPQFRSYIIEHLEDLRADSWTRPLIDVSTGTPTGNASGTNYRQH
ncbi:MAG: ArnT family glycosyltransferase [Chthoniobacterales bacterium]